MTQDMTSPKDRHGLETAIKVLTLLKLLLQAAFYGLLVGGTVWFLVANPLPKLLKEAQSQAIDSLLHR